MRDEDVSIATTPKDEVWRQDKVTLHHYRPLAEAKVQVPVLIVYGLIGRYTMADLQEDRSLVRNLLELGVDLYVVDWGNPTRADRWVTIDDYVDGYLAECVRVICERHGLDKISLLGICEGGVFTTCYAALYPETVESMVLTITPIDFHGDTVENRLGHGFINIWTRSLAPEDIDRLIEAHGTLPGEFMGSVFSMMTPMRTMLKYNFDLLEVVDDEQEAPELPAHGEVDCRPAASSRRGGQAVAEGSLSGQQACSERIRAVGRKVNLKNITCPVLNVFAKDDHIIPPATSQALAGKVGTKDYTELRAPGRACRRLRRRQVAEAARSRYRQVAQGPSTSALTRQAIRWRTASARSFRSRMPSQSSARRHGRDLRLRRRRHAGRGHRRARSALRRDRHATRSDPRVCGGAGRRQATRG